MATEEAAVQKLQSWLNKKTRVHASDGRIFDGKFVCVDRDQNVILADTDEYRIEKPEEKRFMGLVVVPGKHITKFEIQQLDPDAKA
ncbi:hypothetical protein SAICODRAFT_7546 [Saitoella complicata NRRL Y-17804]|uniref:Sm domain-containing protein n=1 Tax=Saitoella complicata (strain BCRC 22490 / CBS 7301 / JCM 7358 / NBRC 10748 / NRRL Y-17804) TaxID=698492 RepID=A0A0E9NGT0_SAICN|nr:uncharacterized protein SAICODRAFT_7546 [Saitoella complicata NRRL Y-17804]ODQ52944.1 hypothetical protein SAICODRAFT_7546 [Saitoella complicata NRRL Y-17804]GAO49092.1 hypothetical protein G7K_3250-t1 [Saitoella complicata NRRL Y-17804]